MVECVQRRDATAQSVTPLCCDGARYDTHAGGVIAAGGGAGGECAAWDWWEESDFGSVRGSGGGLAAVVRAYPRRVFRSRPDRVRVQLALGCLPQSNATGNATRRPAGAAPYQPCFPTKQEVAAAAPQDGVFAQRGLGVARRHGNGRRR
eukprot:COSAG02_NODE_2932_length_7712_cov_2.172468_3_plen_149_part_00